MTAEQKELLNLEIETLDVSWLKELKDEVVSKDFLDLKRFLKRELDSGKTIFPKMADVYSWLVPSSHPQSPSIYANGIYSTGRHTHPSTPSKQ